VLTTEFVLDELVRSKYISVTGDEL